MHTACWITMVTNTNSEYVIRIAYPLQQWLRESATLLRYTYIACLVLFQLRQPLYFFCNMSVFNTVHSRTDGYTKKQWKKKVGMYDMRSLIIMTVLDYSYLSSVDLNLTSLLHNTIRFYLLTLTVLLSVTLLYSTNSCYMYRDFWTANRIFSRNCEKDEK
jgi:hypothetical protein